MFSLWYVFYFVIYYFSFTFNFTCPPSRWQFQYRSCSRFPTQDQSPLAHVLPLSRYSYTSIYALLTKHAQRTSKSSSWTLFRSRPFRFLLFSLVSLHPPLNGTLVDLRHWLKSFLLPGSVILSAHFPSPVCKSYGSFASALHRFGVCFASNEIDSFVNELSTRQIEKTFV